MPCKHRLVTGLVSTGLALCAGCTATPTAQKSATAALVHLTAYETEVGQKIKAEHDYYEDVMAAANQRIVDLWTNNQAFKFEQEAKQFVALNPNPTAEQIGPKLIAFMDSSMAAWTRRDATYQSLLEETRETLRASRTQLELHQGKIRSLRGQLQNLSEARSDKEMLLLAIAFAKEVRIKYEEINRSTDAAPIADDTQ